MTAYEMRIIDWSSGVFSSELASTAERIGTLSVRVVRSGIRCLYRHRMGSALFEFKLFRQFYCVLVEIVILTPDGSMLLMILTRWALANHPIITPDRIKTELRSSLASQIGREPWRERGGQKV